MHKPVLYFSTTEPFKLQIVRSFRPTAQKSVTVLVYQDWNSSLWQDVPFFSKNYSPGCWEKPINSKVNFCTDGKSKHPGEPLCQRCWTLMKKSMWSHHNCSAREESLVARDSWCPCVDKCVFFFLIGIWRLQTAGGDRPSTFNSRTNVEFARNGQVGGHQRFRRTVLHLYSVQNQKLGRRKSQQRSKIIKQNLKTQETRNTRSKHKFLSDMKPLLAEKTGQSGNKHKEGLAYIDKRAGQQRDTGETHEGNDLYEYKTEGEVQSDWNPDRIFKPVVSLAHPPQ